MTPKPITLPKALERDLAGIAGTHVVVAAVLTVSLSDLERYSTFGLQFSDGRIVSGIPSLPPPTLGVYAHRNLEGWTVKRALRGFAHLEAADSRLSNIRRLKNCQSHRRHASDEKAVIV